MLDDDTDSSFHEAPAGFPRDDFDDSSTFMDEGDTTYGSPGLREAFQEQFGGANDQDGGLAGDQEGRSESADNSSRRNKRKRFQPRNIVYSVNDEGEARQEQQGGERREGSPAATAAAAALNLSAAQDYTRRLAAGAAAERENSPMDLSVPPRPDLESDSEDDGSQAADQQAKPKQGGLSVVRPEILFGNDLKAPPSSNVVSSVPPSAQSLITSLSGLHPGFSPLLKEASADEATANTMRDAFREVLKLYGVSNEVAENVLANSSPDQRQGEPVHSSLLLLLLLLSLSLSLSLSFLACPGSVGFSPVALWWSRAASHGWGRNLSFF